jgi:hypothetical protein
MNEQCSRALFIVCPVGLNMYGPTLLTTINCIIFEFYFLIHSRFPTCKEEPLLALDFKACKLSTLHHPRVGSDQTVIIFWILYYFLPPCSLPCAYLEVARSFLIVPHPIQFWQLIFYKSISCRNWTFPTDLRVRDESRAEQSPKTWTGPKMKFRGPRNRAYAPY